MLCWNILLQVKPDSKPYHAPLRLVAYVLQKPFKQELEWFQQQDIIRPLGMDETVEWCYSFVLVPKLNGKVRLCLDPTTLKQVLLLPVHRGPTHNDIFPKSNTVKHLSHIVASFGYHKLKLDKRSWYLKYLHANFAGSGTRDCCLEQLLMEICLKKNIWNIERLTKHNWHCRWHSGYRLWQWWQGSWRHTMESTTNMQTGKPVTKQR